MPCCRPLQAIRVSISTLAVLVGLCAVSCGKAHVGLQPHTPITFVHPWLNVPPECGLRPTFTGEGRALAHATHEHVETSHHSMGTVFLVQAAGVGWALPDIRRMVDHDAVAARTAEDMVHRHWLVPLALDPWPDEPSVVPVAEMRKEGQLANRGK